LKDLERAFALVTAAAPIEKKMREAHLRDTGAALARGVISESEAAQLREADEAVAKVIAVDAFPMEEISPIAAQHRAKPSSPSRREAAE
jgi:acyl-CoA dehydrogenase